jgi:DNA modification methylase
VIKANAAHMPIQDKSVQSIITSPPYWGLREYNIHDVEWPDGWRGQLGNEPTPKLYISHLMLVMAECWRVLRDDGVCFVNLGDTYGGSGQGGYGNWWKHLPAGALPRTARRSKIKPKSMCLIPERFAIGCFESGWIIRNSIIWHKPNGIPSSV